MSIKFQILLDEIIKKENVLILWDLSKMNKLLPSKCEEISSTHANLFFSGILFVMLREDILLRLKFSELSFLYFLFILKQQENNFK